MLGENYRMKSFFRNLLLIFWLSGITYLAQAQADQVGNALGSGNVGAITRYFDNAVSMSVAGSQSTYSRSQAEMVLRDFFGKNPAKGFGLERSGISNGSSYAIGTLRTAHGSFRTYISVRQKDGEYVLQEIRIEK